MQNMTRYSHWIIVHDPCICDIERGRGYFLKNFLHNLKTSKQINLKLKKLKKKNELQNTPSKIPEQRITEQNIFTCRLASPKGLSWLLVSMVVCNTKGIVFIHHQEGKTLGEHLATYRKEHMTHRLNRTERCQVTDALIKCYYHNYWSRNSLWNKWWASVKLHSF